MNAYGEDLELDLDFERCNYTFTNSLFDWHCSMPKHEGTGHYMQPAVHVEAS